MFKLYLWKKRKLATEYNYLFSGYFVSRSCTSKRYTFNHRIVKKKVVQTSFIQIPKTKKMNSKKFNINIDNHSNEF